MPHVALRPSRCRNCGQDLVDLPEAHFCPRCGQETVLHPPTLWEFLHEFITHYVALEGALWRTLAALLLRPGKLTREYFRGRRKHYVLPLRLYLSASFVYFVALKLVGPPAIITEPETPSHIAASQTAEVASTTSAASTSVAESDVRSERDRHSRYDIYDRERYEREERDWWEARNRDERARYMACAKPESTCSWLDRSVARFQIKLDKADLVANVESKLLAASPYAPYVLFLLLPFHAGLLNLMYRGRTIPFGKHFVCSLHLNSFGFIVGLLSLLLPVQFAWAPWLAISAYSPFALCYVYGGRFWPTLARYSVLTLVYSLSLGLGFAGVVVWAIMAS